jgi:hypothetical protein
MKLMLYRRGRVSKLGKTKYLCILFVLILGTGCVKIPSGTNQVNDGEIISVIAKELVLTGGEVNENWTFDYSTPKK